MPKNIPYNLLCENRLNPLIDTRSPRLSWKLPGLIQQTAYQVQAASTEKLLESKPDLWNTDWVETCEHRNITYQGSTLNSRQLLFWRVRIKNENGEISDWSDVNTIEAALLKNTDWDNATWFGQAGGMTSRGMLARREFKLEKPLARARVYLAGIGYSELYINGKKVGDRVMDPGTTDYSRRVLYNVFDISEFLQEGDNCLGIMLGNGWFGSQKFNLQAWLTYQDGSEDYFSTKYTVGRNPWYYAFGPIMENNIFDGEVYDAQLEQTGWNQVGYQMYETENRLDRWGQPASITPPGGMMVLQKNEPIRVTRTIKPVKVSEPETGIFVFDLGQNIAGWARIRVSGKAGQQVTLKFSEVLYENGLVNQEALRKAACRDIYIMKGDGVEEWEPRFTYHGFRYVQVEGLEQADLDMLDGRVVRSDVATRGNFSCSNELLNRIQELVWWTEQNNYHSIPTDCPQRDERMGWLNDMTTRCETAIYNFNVLHFMAKWTDDIQDTQDTQGRIHDTAPRGLGRTPADPVTATYLLTPWLLYQHYGDQEILKRHYDGFKAWTKFLQSQTEKNIVQYSYYGDWAPPIDHGVKESIGAGAVSQSTPGKFISTGYYLLCLRLIARMAEIIGKDKDAAEFANLAKTVAEDTHWHFWNPETGGYGSNNQACNSFALYMDIVPEEQKQQVIENLVKDVEKHDYHITTGNICTKHVLEQLSRYGHVDAAFKIATQQTYPSWGFMLENGATTLWERWEYKTGGAMNSHDHPMLGSVSTWFFKYLAGIQLADDCIASNKLIIKPHLPLGLDKVKASLETSAGPISSEWERKGDAVAYFFSIPNGSAAEIGIPSNMPEQLPAGMEFIKSETGYHWFNAAPGDYNLTVKKQKTEATEYV